MINIFDLIKKASRIDLTTGLFDRTLSEEDMKRARTGMQTTKHPTSDSKFIRRYYKQGDGFVIEDTCSSWRQTRDVSEGRKRTHEDFYPDRIVTSVYDDSGKLKEREIIAMYGAYQQDWNNCFVVRFNPPGRIIGERVKF